MSSDGLYAYGDYIPSHFNGSIVAASYFASLCGTILTIELLHRRGTALNNFRSWLENFACAVAFGVMGIWCMHFIGNRAIVLDDGRDELQLVYAPGFTTLSVFLPIIGLTMAFAAAEYPTNSVLYHWLALSGTGIFAGMSIVGMHYVGNMGITNYNLVYNRAYLVASVIISIGDCLGVLVLFYIWRDKWISALWKRLFCAFFLAGGVSAMHFTASVGCSYQFKMKNQPGSLRSTNIQVIVASALCGAAALTVLGALFLTRYRVWMRKQRAKKVMLACAVFNEDGKICVTTEGVLPASEITDKYNAVNFSETFDTGHPVFHWIFRVSYNWSSVADLVPRMKSHVAKAKAMNDEHSPPSSSASSVVYDPATYSDYTVIFRERFCVAAANLASSLHIPLGKIGVMYDKIIETGTYAEEKQMRHRNLHDDIEIGVRKMMIFGRGQALVLVSRIGTEDADKLLNAGYKFAAIQNVSRSIANSLQVPIEVVEGHCNDLLRYIGNLQNLEKSGTWLSFFAPVPVPHNNGFDVAVSLFDQNQLPDAQIQSTQPAHWQHQLLQGMDGKKSAACVRYLDSLQRSQHWNSIERDFAATVLASCHRLASKVPKEWWAEAHFHGKVLGAPYSRMISGHCIPTAIYAFVVLGDAHTITDTLESVTKVPLNFLSLRQRCYKFSPDHLIMAREIHQEFGAILGRKMPFEKPSRTGSRLKLPLSKRNIKSESGSIEMDVQHGSISETEDSSENGILSSKHPETLVISPTQESEESFERENIYGGILVDSETVVRTDSTAGLDSEAFKGFGAVADASRDKPEDTFIDELLHVLLNRFLPMKPGC